MRVAKVQAKVHDGMLEDTNSVDGAQMIYLDNVCMVLKNIQMFDPRSCLDCEQMLYLPSFKIKPAFFFFFLIWNNRKSLQVLARQI